MASFLIIARRHHARGAYDPPRGAGPSPHPRGPTLAGVFPSGPLWRGAAHLDELFCVDVEAYGKHLLYRLDGEIFLHVHLGLYGRIKTRKLPAPEPVGAVRVRLEGDTHLVDINGPAICETLDGDGFQALTDRIGPDVLRDDADPERAFRRISRSRASIGRLIMNQAVMAGIGNIDRTEILWRQGIHPDRSGRAITREEFDAIWNDAVRLLEIGVRKTAIVTVDNAPPARNRYRERVNIFNKDRCPVCESPIRRMEIDTRRAFACDVCQPAP